MLKIKRNHLDFSLPILHLQFLQEFDFWLSSFCVLHEQLHFSYDKKRTAKPFSSTVLFMPIPAFY